MFVACHDAAHPEPSIRSPRLRRGLSDAETPPGPASRSSIRMLASARFGHAIERALNAVPSCGSAPWRQSSNAFRTGVRYLLGLYLGDGTPQAIGNAWILRLALDSAYPIIGEVARGDGDEFQPAARSRRPIRAAASDV